LNKKISLSLLISNYQKCGSDESFTKIYNFVSSTFPKKIRSLAERYKLDELDVESVINLKLFEVVKNFDRAKGEFMKQLNTAVKFGCIDLLRKDIKREEINETGLTANLPEEESISFIESLTPLDNLVTTEEIAIANIQKKRDQRQLIATLLCNADDDTRQSASAYMMTGSYGEAAKLLGTNKMKVSRHVKRLSFHFDGNQNGDYRDYFTVPTVSVG
jgi:DNA-directed RNA polymerase specialized sigma24 family protein